MSTTTQTEEGVLYKLELKEYLLSREIAKYHDLEREFKIKKKDSDAMSDMGSYLKVYSQTKFMSSHSRIEEQLISIRNNIKHLCKLGFDPTNKLSEGSLLKVNNEYYIVSIDSDPIDFLGKKIKPISTKNELYKAMSSSYISSTFLLHGKIYNIQLIA